MSSRNHWKLLGSVLLVLGSVVGLDELRTAPNRDALRTIRTGLHRGMPHTHAKALIRENLSRRWVYVAEHRDSRDEDVIRVDSGAARSWSMHVRYRDGYVTGIRAWTENGPDAPTGFPPNEP
jgi:hypothetical protein